MPYNNTAWLLVEMDHFSNVFHTAPAAGDLADE
jgi:hypothetical protein